MAYSQFLSFAVSGASCSRLRKIHPSIFHIHPPFSSWELSVRQKKYAKLKKVLEKFGKIFYEGGNIQYRNEARLKGSPTGTLQDSVPQTFRRPWNC